MICMWMVLWAMIITGGHTCIWDNMYAINNQKYFFYIWTQSENLYRANNIKWDVLIAKFDIFSLFRFIWLYLLVFKLMYSVLQVFAILQRGCVNGAAWCKPIYKLKPRKTKYTEQKTKILTIFFVRTCTVLKQGHIKKNLINHSSLNRRKIP